MFSASDYIALLFWPVFAALVNIALAQFYFLWRRKRFLTSSTIAMAYSFAFLGAYIFYSVQRIFPYFIFAYFRTLRLLEPGSQLIQSLADVIGISYSWDMRPLTRIWILFLTGAVALPALEYKLIFSRWLYPYLHHLTETVRELKSIRAESDNWTDKVWRKNDTENAIAEYDGSVEDLCRQWLEHWELNHERDFSWPAFLACYFLGEKSFMQTRQNLQNDNIERIRRWSIITGKEIPKW
jgi:hypothetical protein